MVISSLAGVDTVTHTLFLTPPSGSARIVAPGITVVEQIAYFFTVRFEVKLNRLTAVAEYKNKKE
jgi:hypothetical protein